MNNIFVQKLSDEQKIAIEETENVLLIAIPGSGKTRSLTNKVIYEYNEDNPKKIIAITYTRRAADEMQSRIFKQLGEMPENIWIGTIHKFCLDFIIRKYGSYSTYFSKPFTILADQDRENLILELKRKYKVADLDEINFTLAVTGTPIEELHADLVNEYYNIIIENKNIDFNYILFESYKMLYENPEIAEKISKKIKMLCIDEYQDTQELQYQILGLICKKSADIKIFTVGDPNQAIYEGLGGVIKTKDELEKVFGSPFKEMFLTGCYRSHQEIIDFYKNFCCQKVEIYSKTNDYIEPEVKVIKSLNRTCLESYISKLILKLVEEGIPENEICILAPQWYFLFDFSNKIKRLLPNIKFDAPGIVPLKKDEENIIYKLCQILLSNYSYQNRKRIQMITHEVIKQFHDEYAITIDHNVQGLLNIIYNDIIHSDIATEFLEHNLKRIFQKLNLLSFFDEQIDSFIKGTLDRIQKYNDIGLENDRLFFEKTLRSKEGIVISTIHAIKGEEYRAVIAFGLLDGYVPHWSIKFKDNKKATIEAKRLLFVIGSRAKEKLYFISENGRTTKSGFQYKMTNEICRVINSNNKY